MVADLDAMVEWSKNLSEDPALFIDLSFTAKDYFEDEVDGAQPINDGVQLVITLEGDLWIRADVLYESDALVWPEMEAILYSWGSERGCELEYLLPKRANLPRLWEVSFSYPRKDAKILEVCEFARDIIEVA